MRELERGHLLFEIAVMLVLVSAVIIVCSVIVAALIDSYVPPLEVYEKAYAECVAQETISAERCHDLAVRVAYPNRGG